MEGEKEEGQSESENKMVHANSTRVCLGPALMSEPEVSGIGKTLEEYGGFEIRLGYKKRMSPQHHSIEDEELSATTAQPGYTS
jgi:hypothetical protein